MAGASPSMARDRYDYVIVGGGSAGCALANRLSTDPGNRGARAGGGPQRLPVRRVRPHARGADVPQRQPALRLALRVRAGAAPARPAGRPRPGQGARRLQQHQRHDLPAGQPAGLRAVGRRPRHGQLGLRPLPALLHAHGELPGRRGRRRVPRAQRPARAGARARHQPAVRRVPAGGAGGGLPADRRRQRVPPGGLRQVRPQRLPRTAAVGGPRVPAPGDVAAEPRRAHERAGHEGGVRGHPGGRRRVLALRPAVGAPGGRGRGRAVRAARSTHRSCCSCPGWATRRCCAAWASRWSPTCPAWARTSRTTWRSTCSTRARSRCRCSPTSRRGTGRGSARAGCSCAAGPAPPTTSRRAASSAATTRSTTRT